MKSKLVSRLYTFAFVLVTACFLGCPGAPPGDVCPAETFRLTASVEGSGDVSLSPDNACYEAGTRVTITAEAASGSAFDHWEGNASGTDPGTKVTMNGDRTVVAVFVEPTDCATGADCDTGEVCTDGKCVPEDGSDLALKDLSVARSSNSARTFTDCSFNIVNNGPTALSSEGILVEYYLSADTTIGNADDRIIGDTSFVFSITPGATVSVTLSSAELGNMARSWTDGLVTDGSYHVIARVRIADGTPSDPSSANDFGQTSGTIAYSVEGPSADLALTGLSLARASNSARTFTGGSFNIVNNGPTALTSEELLVDYYLSADTTFGNADDRIIGDTSFVFSITPGATVAVALSSTELDNLARSWTEGLVASGNYFVIARVRISDGTPSDPSSANDFGQTSGTIAYSVETSSADLACTGLIVTRASDSARTFTGCSFNIVNNGPTALSSGGILVEYYLSADTVFGNADDRNIGDTGFTVSIAPGETFPITLSSTGLSSMARNWTDGLVTGGNYFVIAKVRISDGSPSDPDFANDFDLASETITYSTSPDTCQYAFDGECDEPGIGTGACPSGTDFTDCQETGTGTDTCQYASDGECDEPGIGTGACLPGTDFTDCQETGTGNDTCPFAFDGECDEPGTGTGACAPGTDFTDCQ